MAKWISAIRRAQAFGWAFPFSGHLNPSNAFSSDLDLAFKINIIFIMSDLKL
jgi:hypothetical protein